MTMKISNDNIQISNKILSILFAGARPFSIRRLGELCEASTKDVEEAMRVLETQLENLPLMLQTSGNDVQLVTRPEYVDIVKQVVRDEMAGELSRPSLETLTILAYRGPLTRPELEQIRGVHSSLILRNLMLRGLVEEKEDARLGQPTYAVTFAFIQHLGLKSLEELPDYESLRGHEHVVDVLKEMEEEAEAKEKTQEASV
ncbi:MAG: SMC-Scp complex subunit ScpB [Candidatus Parcubacteria bacterium]|jgi:segregation and condensation protein B